MSILSISTSIVAHLHIHTQVFLRIAHGELGADSVQKTGRIRSRDTSREANDETAFGFDVSNAQDGRCTERERKKERVTRDSHTQAYTHDNAVRYAN